MLKIFVHFDPPPIPMREFDYSAVTDNYDGPGSPIGYGLTAHDAFMALLERLEEIWEETDR